MTDTTFGDRYLTVGLRKNPFAAPQLNARACPAFVTRGLPNPPPPWSQALVQVIGDSGFGKTSQLEHWRDSAPGPMHYIPRQPYRSRWHAPPRASDSDGLVYGDEIDRMPKPLRRRWFAELSAQRVTLVIGTHVDLARLGSKHGFAVTTHHLAPFDRATLAEAINLRLTTVAVTHDVPELFSSGDIDRILDESRGIPEEADVICHRHLAGRVH